MKSNIHRKALVTIFLILVVFCAKAQSPFKGLENLFTTPQNYIIHYTKTPPVIDGDISESTWSRAAWTDQFQDIEGDKKPHPTLHTQVKMLWGDSCIYIAAKLQEPNVWAYETKRDAIVYHDNDFEVFINPSNTIHQYYEFEVNALNTIFDLFLDRPYRDWGSAMINWNAEGLRTAVKVQGTLNNPTDTDRGWTVEIAIPFKSISIGNNVNIPADGDLWRINFSRVEWDTNVHNGKYVKQTTGSGAPKPEHNWVWSAQGVIDMHFPERWGYLRFSKSSSVNNAFTMSYSELQKRYLWLIYYHERLYFRKHHRYALSLKQLGINKRVAVSGKANLLTLEATKHQFMGLISDKQSNIIRTINQQSEINQISKENE
ncbi:MAG: carbohydrate-binding family 9-like protein [Sphingobacteriales bacterium]